MKTKALGHSKRRDQDCLTEDEGSRISKRLHHDCLTLKVKALGAPETSGTVCQTKQLNIPEDQCFDTASLHNLPISKCKCYVNCIGRTVRLKADRLTCC
jgi:hypothetical protein